MERGIERLTVVLSIWTLTCLCFLFLCGTAFGEETEPILPKHTFAIGIGVSSVHYKEDIETLGVEVEQDGSMYEVIGDYTYHNNQLMIKAGLSYSAGDLDYDGYTQRGAPVETDSEDWIVECRGLIGYDYLRGKHVLTPFLGIGYRYWNGELDRAGRNERETEYWYLPIGMRISSPLSGNWTWGMNMEYDLFLDGEVDYERLFAPRYHLDSGYGARFSLRFSRQWAGKTHLSIEPYITYWDIDKTDVILLALPGPEPEQHVALDLWEPDNDTTTYGLRISLEF